MEPRRKELLIGTMRGIALKNNEPIPVVERRTRQDDKWDFPRQTFKRKSYKKNPMYRGEKLWNSLPVAIQREEEKLRFKKALKKKLDTWKKGKRKTAFKTLRVKNFAQLRKYILNKRLKADQRKLV